MAKRGHARIVEQICAGLCSLRTNTAAPLSNSRISRDDAMYATDTGLVDLAALVKKYVKSLFGAHSPQFQQISGLEFTRPR